MTAPVFPHRLVLHRPVMRHDAQLGHAYAPNVSVRVVHERGAYMLRTNAAGMRSDRELVPRGDAPRVVFLGDSFAAGDGVANEERFSDLIARDHGIDCVNLAISGGGADQMLLVARDRRDVLRDADVVVWCVAAHAVDRLGMRSRTTIDARGKPHVVAKPWLRLDGDRLEIEGVPVPDDRSERDISTLPPIEPSRRRFERRARRVLADRASAVLRATFGPPRDDGYLDASSTSLRLLRAVGRELRACAPEVPFVVLPLPSREHIEGRLRWTFESAFADLAASLDDARFVDVSRAAAALTGEQRRRLCYPEDGHYTPAGHRLIADALAPMLPAARTATVDGSAKREAARVDALLEVSWDHGASRARVFTGADESPPYVDEREVAGDLGCNGAVPFTAINVALERALDDACPPTDVVLRSPSPAELFDPSLSVEDWIATAAPWVRWLGAAEVDVRRMLAYEGDVLHEFDGPSVPPRALDPDDEESRWLRAALSQQRERILRRPSALVELAARWERATRRARYAPLPLPEPTDAEAARHGARKLASCRHFAS